MPRFDPAKLVPVLRMLADAGYAFVPPTPATHARYVRRRAAGLDVRDLLGWSLPVPTAAIDPALVAACDAAGMLVRDGDWLRSRLRVARLGERLFLHSAYPTEREDAVFFGPDTYRFAAFIAAGLADAPASGLTVDVGGGSGAGLAVAADRAAPGARFVMTDINPSALALAEASLAAGGVRAEVRLGSGLAPVDGAPDLVLCNPPFIADGEERAYRDGGDSHGAELSIALPPRRSRASRRADGCCSIPAAPSSPASTSCARRWPIWPRPRGQRLPIGRSIPTFSARSWTGRPMPMSSASPRSAPCSPGRTEPRRAALLPRPATARRAAAGG